MADGVHTPAQRMKTTASQPMVDRPATDARIEELRPRDHAMLALRQRRDEPIDATRVKLTPYLVVNFTTLAHEAIVAGEMPRQGRRVLRIC